MMKQKGKLRYHDIYEDLISKYPDCDYYIDYSERSNGKTYSALYYALEQYFKLGRACAYVRRWYDDIKSEKGGTLLNNLLNDKRIEEITKGKYNGVVYKNKRFFLALYDEEHNLESVDNNECITLFSLTEEEHYKSSAYPKIKTIIFDEFIARKYEMQNEFIIWNNLLSTIIRLKDDVKIIMLANNVNLHATSYFKNMGLNHVKNQEINTIDLYHNPASNLKLAVMRSSFVDKKGVRQKKPSDKYFSFDNPNLKMITEGKWEMSVYPTLTEKYTPKDVIYIFYIVYEEEILQCEIINLHDNFFIYIHKKTTPIKANKDTLIYTTDYHIEMNYRRSLFKPQSTLEENIVVFFKTDRVRYQDNEVGEIVRAFINFTK